LKFTNYDAPHHVIFSNTDNFIWEQKLDNESEDKTRITTAEIKFTRKTAKYSWMDSKKTLTYLKNLK
jgi:hypothetical protein